MTKTAVPPGISSSRTIPSLVAILCALLMGMAPVATVGAQTPGPGPHGRSPDQIVAAMKTRLGLTEEQEAQVKPVLEDEFVKRRAILETSQGQGPEGRSSLRGELQKLRSATDQRLGAILTKAQMDEYRNMQQEARQHMRRGRSAPAPN